MESVVMENLFAGAYKNKTVLVTGNTGFKGSWLAHWLRRLGAKVYGYSLPPPTTPSQFALIQGEYETISGNILDKDFLNSSMRGINPDLIFHLAAQSLVRSSYQDPAFTYETNVIGTLNVLEAARKCDSVQAIINVTTDKVYENREDGKPFREEDPFGGHDLYSSSKACSEILTQSWRRSFFQNGSILLASARAGNVIGGGDWSDDRLIPDAVKAANMNKPVLVRYPASVRPWQHVLESLNGYLTLGQHLLSGKKEFASGWNFGPQLSDCISVAELLDKISRCWNAIRWEQDGNENVYESKLLMLDSSKAQSQLDWHPVWNLDEAIVRTIEWYRKYYEEKRVITDEQLDAYSSLLKK